MEKLARDIAQELKCLPLEPDKANMTAAANRRGYPGSTAELVEEARVLWEQSHFEAYLKWRRAHFKDASSSKVKKRREYVMDRVRDVNSGRFKASQCLIMGAIQAAKTANFIGQMTLAADRGVGLFIVLAGVANYPRGQTQERMEEGFTGFSTGKAERVGIGKKALFQLPYSHA